MKTPESAAVGEAMDYCDACNKPFDEVHPLDFMNDLIRCSDFAEPRYEPALIQAGAKEPYYRSEGQFHRCRMDHSWREHVAKSYDGKWLNPHVRVARFERRAGEGSK